MAKIKFGMMMTDARGKLGGQVFSKNRSGSYVRTKVTPVNPRTSFQMFSRALLGQLSAGWSGLTQAQRSAWNQAVDAWQKTDVFGDIKKPTGKNLFVGLNKNLLSISRSMLATPPDKTEMAEISFVQVSIDTTAETLTVLGSPTITDGAVVLWGTPVLSDGTSFVKNRLRRVVTSASGTFDPATTYTQYVDRFGAPTAGANVWFGLSYIAESGQQSVQVIGRAIVT